MVIKVAIEYTEKGSKEYQRKLRATEAELKKFTKEQEKATAATKKAGKTAEKASKSTKKVGGESRKVSEQLGLFNSVMGNSDTALGRLSLTAEKSADGFGAVGLAAIGAGVAFSFLGPVIGDLASEMLTLLAGAPDKWDEMSDSIDRTKTATELLAAEQEIYNQKLARMPKLQAAFTVASKKAAEVVTLEREAVDLAAERVKQQEELNRARGAGDMGATATALARLSTLDAKITDTDKKIETARKNNRIATIALSDQTKDSSKELLDVENRIAVAKTEGVQKAKLVLEQALKARDVADEEFRQSREQGEVEAKQIAQREADLVVSEARKALKIEEAKDEKAVAALSKKTAAEKEKALAKEKKAAEDLAKITRENELLAIGLIDEKAAKQGAFLEFYQGELEAAQKELEGTVKGNNKHEEALRKVLQAQTDISRIEKAGASEKRRNDAKELKAADDKLRAAAMLAGLLLTQEEAEKQLNTTIRRGMGVFLSRELDVLRIEAKEAAAAVTALELALLSAGAAGDDVLVSTLKTKLAKAKQLRVEIALAISDITTQTPAEKEAAILSAIGIQDPKKVSSQLMKMTAAFDALAGAAGAAFGAWIDGSESAGAAFEKFLFESLKATAVDAAVQALKHGAYALGSWAFGNPVKAKLHAGAALKFATLAAVTGGIAKAVGPPSDTSDTSSSGGSSTGGGGGSDRVVYVNSDDLDQNPRATALRIQRALANGRRITGGNPSPQIQGQ